MARFRVAMVDFLALPAILFASACQSGEAGQGTARTQQPGQRSSDVPAADRYLGMPPPGTRPEVFAKEVFPGYIHNLYFMSRATGHDDLYVTRFVAGTYQEPEPLPGEINKQDQRELGPYVAPDESYLVFSRSPDRDHYVLYVSKNEGRRWSEATKVILGDDLERIPISPVVSPDGDYLFFMDWYGESSEEFRAYWVRSEVLWLSARPGS